jgi:hypothetical protein
MPEAEQVNVSEANQLAEWENILSDTPVQQSVETEVVSTEPAVTETPQENVQQTTVDAPIEFVIQDAPTEAQPSVQAQTENNTDDFDSKFQERFSKEFGIDLKTAKQKLSQSTETAEQSTYKTEQGKLFDELFNKGVSPDVIFNVAMKDLSKSDDLQVLDYQMQLKYPNATAEQRQAFLEETYKQGEDFLEREKQAGAFKMMQDAEAARKELDGLKITALQTPAERQQSDVQANEQVRVKAWESGLAKKVTESFTHIETKAKINVSYDGTPREQEVLIKVPVTAKDKAEIESFLKSELPYMTNATTDAQGQEFVRQVIQNKFIIDNFSKIVQGAVNNATSYINEQNKKYLHNETPPRLNQGAVQGGSVKSDVQLLRELDSLVG